MEEKKQHCGVMRGSQLLFERGHAGQLPVLTLIAVVLL